MTLEERGIKAIIGMQALAGITEATEQAKIGWDGMSSSDRATTLRVAEKVLPEGWDMGAEK